MELKANMLRDIFETMAIVASLLIGTIITAIGGMLLFNSGIEMFSVMLLGLVLSLGVGLFISIILMKEAARLLSLSRKS